MKFYDQNHLCWEDLIGAAMIVSLIWLMLAL
jgi:hypothetical protein